jgi:hypothetical protein
VVERHSTAKTEAGGNADFSLMAEPSAGRNQLLVLHNTLFAASDKVEAATPGLNQQVANIISALSAHAEEADDWTEWTQKAQQNRDSLILLVHIEENKNLGEDQLEIGNAKFLIKNQLDHTRLQGAGSTQPPLVVLIGCEANDIENHGFDVAAQLINQGAAIVLTNFTKIRGRHAGPVAIKLVEFLAATRGQEFTFGEIVLKLRQHLLAAGLMASLALVAYGDADWKIKV